MIHPHEIEATLSTLEIRDLALHSNPSKEPLARAETIRKVDCLSDAQLYRAILTERGQSPSLHRIYER